jgi:hypothetical protein
LWWQRSLHRWWWRIQETDVAYGGQEVGRRKGAEEVVVSTGWVSGFSLLCLIREWTFRNVYT